MTWAEVAIVIPTVAARRRLCTELVAAVRQHCPRAAVLVHHHQPGTSPRDDFPAAIAAALRTGRPWLLLLEDDVQLAPTFGTMALEALAEAEARGAAAAVLFSRARRDVALWQRGVRWRWQPPSAFCMMQAIGLRATATVGFAAWAPTWYAAHPQHHHAADLLLGAWLSQRRARMLVHLPSLVQHRRGPSTLHPHRGARQSETYRLAFGECDDAG